MFTFKKKKYKYIDLFAGIGGFHIAMSNVGAECVFASEIDKYARQTYETNFKEKEPSLFENGNFNNDITKINPNDIPDFDILCAGFPCQAFSQISASSKSNGRKGFKDSKGRGLMFFYILEIIKTKRPACFFLENVRGLLNHDGGRTFKIISDLLKNEGYSFNFKTIRGYEMGVPQRRERVYMIGFKNETTDESGFNFPNDKPLRYTMSDIVGGKCEKEIGNTLLASWISSPTSHTWDHYMVDGKDYFLTVEDGKKMMGLPEDYTFPHNRNRSLKQMGNAVIVPVIEEIGKEILKYLPKWEKTQTAKKENVSKYYFTKQENNGNLVYSV